MIGFGVVLLLIGSICEWVINTHEFIGNQSVNMDVVGVIFLVLGIISITLGLSSRWSKSEDVLHDEINENGNKIVRNRYWDKKNFRKF